LTKRHNELEMRRFDNTLSTHVQTASILLTYKNGFDVTSYFYCCHTVCSCQ